MRKLKRILYTACIVIIIFSAWNLWVLHQSTKRANELYAELAAKAAAEEAAKAEEKSDVEAGSMPEVNPLISALKEENRDAAGWINVPNTVINYPVMQTRKDNDFYLNHDFNKNPEGHGTPFFDVNCMIGVSENLVIYAHHMQDGTMFQNLMRYKEPEFCESNDPIVLDTMYSSAKYRVIYVMIISAAEAEQFPYYTYIDLSDEEIYNEFLTQCAQYAIWSSEELPKPGTGLLTLSTCEYTKNNGRLVVVAAEIG